MSQIASLLKTPLFEMHQQLGARIVDFGGWALPVNYSSQVEEHHAVRNQVGMFDVSHMTVSDITGKETLPFLSNLLANDIAKVSGQSGKAMYSCMLNDKGGVIDDLIVYYLDDQHCRMVTNAATNKKDLAWLQEQAKKFDVSVTEKPQLALIAVQGPAAIEKIQAVFAGSIANVLNELKRFQGAFAKDVFIGRTGYTGEDGVEMIMPREQADIMWSSLIDAGVQPCGLGARDTLRLEAGMALYGSDLDEEHTPLESGLSWTVAIKDDRQFIGRPALANAQRYKMIGLVFDGKGILRGHQKIFLNNQCIGEITSGGFSPTLECSIALARIKNISDIDVGSTLQVEIRKKFMDVRVVNYPFVKK
jgi:aminomethyltransferase